MGFLEVVSADPGRRYLCGNAKHRHPRAVTVESAVDEMQVAGSALASADGKFARQMPLCGCREGRNLLVTRVDPFDLAPMP
jgi:hypothetical protein